MRYAVVIEKAKDNYSAYVPDLPGCVATGETVAEAESEIRERSASTSTACGLMGCQPRSRRASPSMWRRDEPRCRIDIVPTCPFIKGAQG